MDVPINLLIVGFDSPDMVDHVRDAQRQNPRTFVLTYDDSVGGTKGARDWYKRRGGLPACVGQAPAGKSCDEYPMYKTREGGLAMYSQGRVSLRWVSAWQNTYVGIQFGVIAKAIKNRKVRDKHIVVITSNSLPTVGIPGSK